MFVIPDLEKEGQAVSLELAHWPTDRLVVEFQDCLQNMVDSAHDITHMHSSQLALQGHSPEEK